MNLFQILETTVNDDFCRSAAGYKIFGFLGHILNFIQIAVPIIIILLGTIDLIKAVVAQKDDEMKKAQSILIKRLIVGVVIFFVPMIVKFLISMVGGDIDSPCISCLNTPSDCIETGNNIDKNSGDTVEGGIPTQNVQSEAEAKTICEKCESNGQTCIEHNGKYKCDSGSTYNE